MGNSAQEINCKPDLNVQVTVLDSNHRKTTHSADFQKNQIGSVEAGIVMCQAYVAIEDFLALQ